MLVGGMDMCEGVIQTWNNIKHTEKIYKLIISKHHGPQKDIYKQKPNQTKKQKSLWLLSEKTSCEIIFTLALCVIVNLRDNLKSLH